jgi:hypothetical protein
LHLRALLDDLPNCDERGVLRSWVFAKDAPSNEALTDETLALIQRGIQMLGDHLVQLGTDLQARTSGVIPHAELIDPEQASVRVRFWLLGE